jgi:hypothetical protein
MRRLCPVLSHISVCFDGGDVGKHGLVTHSQNEVIAQIGLSIVPKACRFDYRLDCVSSGVKFVPGPNSTGRVANCNEEQKM